MSQFNKEKMFWSDSFSNLLVITIMIILLYFKNYFKAVYLALRLPGPPILPLLGNVLLVTNSKKMEAIAIKMPELYSPVMRIWISMIPFFLVYEPKHLQIVLGSNKYSTKNMLYSLLHNFIGDGLITNTGEKWKLHRKLIQPYFHINVLKVYFDAFFKYSTVMVADLEQETDVNVVKFANRFVLDVLQDTILGLPARTDQSPYRKGKLFMPYRITRPWLLLQTLFKRTEFSKQEAEHQVLLRNYTRKILENKKNSFGCSNFSVNNLMEMMIEISKENEEFTEEDIINEACTFMLAGQDSIGAALTFSLYFLALHQDVQDRVMDELKSILKGANRPITFEDVGEMKYLEQCIKETLRLCPSVPIIARVLTEDLSLGKYVLPAGANVLVAPFATHRLPHVFPDPLKFNPDRFSTENKSQIHPYAYIPFSAGPRNCIGYKFALIELKTVISQILTKYHLTLAPGHEKLNFSYRITLKAKNGIWLRLRKRCEN
ncbi:probable cytochrome P450 4aa1 isoform X1 [Zophobas morio]|uniref:probable cytochrome P450 4aa1 isoform X1 n=2 Tax=Zophobas morio TaxID=2755281 RepID=UPI003082FBE8